MKEMTSAGSDTNSEILLDLIGYEDLYAISSLGYIYSKRRQRKMKPSIDGWRYRQIYLSNQGTTTRFSLHRLVASYFVPNPDGKKEVNHKDGDKGNNAASNLEWSTRSENMLHGFRIGIMDHKGDKHGYRKLSSTDVLDIRKKISNGVRLVDLEREYGVSNGCICDIKAKRTWSHI